MYPTYKPYNFIGKPEDRGPPPRERIRIRWKDRYLQGFKAANFVYPHVAVGVAA